MENMTVRVSQRLLKTSYYDISGKKIRPPLDQSAHPSLGAIKHRNDNEYRD
jgi:hypothetical protein